MSTGWARGCTLCNVYYLRSIPAFCLHWSVLPYDTCSIKFHLNVANCREVDAGFQRWRSIGFSYSLSTLVRYSISGFYRAKRSVASKLLLTTNRSMYTRCRLISKSMTLDDLEG